MREIKFRAWFEAGPEVKGMIEDVVPYRATHNSYLGCFVDNFNEGIKSSGYQYDYDGFSHPDKQFIDGDEFNIHTSADTDWIFFEGELMQYTGLKDKNGKEIYEGDIFRVEEDGAEDGTDQIYYLVVVWVTEWAMFCTLRVSDEYFNYLHGGVKALDEPMFWAYTLEDTNDRRFYLCGNIHQNPELLKP